MSDRLARLTGLMLVALSAGAGWLIGVVDRMPESPERSFGQLGLALVSILCFVSGLAAIVRGRAVFAALRDPPAPARQDKRKRR